MRTDPRVACANAEERLFWALVHDGIAHPFMALTGWSRLSLMFHDYTSNKAWPRVYPSPFQPVRVPSRFGLLIVERPRPGFYTVQHGRVAHRFCTIASDAIEAVEIAERHFQSLANEFGGAFSAYHADAPFIDLDQFRRKHGRVR